MRLKKDTSSSDQLRGQVGELAHCPAGVDTQTRMDKNRDELGEVSERARRMARESNSRATKNFFERIARTALESADTYDGRRRMVLGECRQSNRSSTLARHTQDLRSRRPSRRSAQRRVAEKASSWRRDRSQVGRLGTPLAMGHRLPAIRPDRPWEPRAVLPVAIVFVSTARSGAFGTLANPRRAEPRSQLLDVRPIWDDATRALVRVLAAHRRERRVGITLQ